MEPTSNSDLSWLKLKYSSLSDIIYVKRLRHSEIRDITVPPEGL
jgi:hypothetical protein